MDIDRTFGDPGFSEYAIVFGPNVRYYLPRDTDMQVFFHGFAGYGFVPSHQLFKIMMGPGVNFFFSDLTFISGKGTL